nr:hypothetical protein [Paracandidimonas lactea]
MAELAPLPLQGKAWPTWIKVLAVVVLTLIGLKIGQIAASPLGQNISPAVSASIVLCFAGLIVLARYMIVSQTSITESGIEQTWLGKREIAWDQIQYAKFIPLVASKRLVCFPARGRPVVFQAGTRELQIAFARIALAYRRRR